MLPYLLFSALYIFVIARIQVFLTLTILPVAVVAYSHWFFSRSRMLLNLFLVYLLLWMPFFLFAWKAPVYLFLLYLPYGLACYLLGWRYISRFDDKNGGIGFKIFGAIVVLFTLYIFTFKQVSEGFAGEFRLSAFADFWILLSLFCGGVVFLYGQVRKFIYPAHKYGLLPEERVLIPVLFMALPVILGVFAAKTANLTYLFLVNFFYICLVITVLVIGYRRNEAFMKVLSCVFLVLFVSARYAEIEWSLLYKSLLFILTGVIILVLGVILEKNKERVVIIDGK
jgi:hypothetical protein